MSFFRRFVSLALILCIALPLPAQAGMLPTDAAITSDTKERIVSFLERSDVRAQLESMGVTPADARARVATLTDAEAADLAGQIERMPAGADAAGAIVGAIILVFIVLLITDLLGLTKVFPFTRPIR
ncbi:MAG TPA: PA2779 family protein [Burkholderiales bacterium]|nr:PA2779 family protein [Burkholderiales bacterium]